MTTNLPVYIGADAALALVDYCQQHPVNRLTLVADENTYRAAGQGLEATLKVKRFDPDTIILTGREVVADESYLIQVLLQLDNSPRTFLAVGSGTLTDIVRFVSHRTRNDFISVPTAPSVDGFTSIGAPLVVGGLKQTIITQPPVAVFSDLAILQAAPRAMTAAGLGDMLGKYTSLADWQLGHLLWREPYDDGPAERTRQAVDRCVAAIAAIGQASPEGIYSLMAGLIESGLSMLQFGSSRPASGAEHHLSHYWEMKLLRERRPAILHGAKVGVATLITARLFQAIGQMSLDEVETRLRRTPQPSRAEQEQQITTGYDPVAAAQIMGEHAPFLNLTAPEYAALQRRISDTWPQIQAIAATVPSPEALASWLRQVGGPTEPARLGLSDHEVHLALQYGHYLRNRFTIVKLGRMLGLVG